MEADQRLRGDPQALQMTGQLRRAPIELPVAQLLIPDDERHGVGCRLGSGLEELVEAPIGRGVRFGRSPERAPCSEGYFHQTIPQIDSPIDFNGILSPG